MADDNTEITTKYCSTCKQDVPSANFDMHVIHCQRFLTPCPECGESVNKRQLQEHIDENHAQVKCDVCGENMEKMDLDQHKTSSCRRRNVNCQYCEITLPACDIEEHKESCGSRTEECENCKRRILVKDLDGHISSGCRTPVKANGNGRPQQDKRKVPERLIGGQDVTMADSDGLGFAFHPQFKPLFPYTSGGFINPYFPPSDSHAVEHLNDSPKVQSPSPSKKTATNFSIPSSQKRASPFVNKRPENSDKQSSFDVKSRGQTRNKYSVAGSNRMNAGDVRQLPANKYGIGSSDSDSDTMEEKTPPDLSDDTFLPCEFCEELFPADSLGFHQANCDYVPPTPRPRSVSPPKLKRLSLDNVQSGAPFEPYQDMAAALPSNGSPFRSHNPDIGEGSAPCEFCFSSLPLTELALHQVTCSLNPNLQQPTPPPKRKPPLVKSDSSKSPLPKLHPPQVEPLMSEPSRTTSRSSNVQTKSSTNFNAKSTVLSPNVQAREKRTLAPNFSGKVTEPPPDKTEATLPKSKLSLNEATTLERKPQKKRKSRPIPRKMSPNVPQKFSEVNVLGGDKQQVYQHPDNRGGNPFQDQFSSSQAGFNPGSFLNSGPFLGDRTISDHAANTKNPFQRNPHTGRIVGVNQLTNPQSSPGAQKINRGGRGQNPTRGRNFTRGRSYGSSTVTIPRRGNPRHISGIRALERTVNPQPDLSLQGQPASEGRNGDVNRQGFNRPRGAGQRLGSGDSRTRSNRTLHPPKNNDWD